MKKILIPIIMFLILVLSTIAATVVNLDPEGILANGTYKATSNIVHNFNVTGNQSIWKCFLYSTENGSNGVGSWSQKETDSGVVNNTNTNFSIRQDVLDVSGTQYSWDIFCNATTDSAGDWGAGGNLTEGAGHFNYSVDTVDPSITVVSPSDNSWDIDGNISFAFTVVDNNADTCIFQTTLNGSQDGNVSDSWNASSEITSYTNNTIFNLTFGQANIFADNNAGDYIWNIVCNDSVGSSHDTQLSTNYTIYVDSVSPGGFQFNTSLWRTNNRGLFNATIATDYTPQVGWNASTELNFSRYEVSYFKDAYGVFNATTDLQVNVTTRTTISVNISTLAADSSYIILVTAYDLAGNSVNMTTIGYNYTTDSTNRALLSGWNILGNVGNSFTLSSILNWTSATTASIWNSTHEFVSHVSGGSNGPTSVGAGEVVLIFLSADANFEDLIHNSSAVNIQSHNITNQSSSDWNLVMMRDNTDDKIFRDLDVYINCDPVGTGCAQEENNATRTDFFSLYNNSASSGNKYIPFVANWTINNETPLTYGDTTWIFVNSADASNFTTINWSAV